MSDTHKSWTEEIKVSGENLLRETERLIHEGNVSHLVIKNEADHTIAEFPINVAIIGIILVPILAAIAAIAVYAAHFTVIVTRVGPPLTPELVGATGVVDVPLVVVPTPPLEPEVVPNPPIPHPSEPEIPVPGTPTNPEVVPPAPPVVVPPSEPSTGLPTPEDLGP